MNAFFEARSGEPPPDALRARLTRITEELAAYDALNVRRMATVLADAGADHDGEDVRRREAVELGADGAHDAWHG